MKNFECLNFCCSIFGRDEKCSINGHRQPGWASTINKLNFSTGRRQPSMLIIKMKMCTFKFRKKSFYPNLFGNIFYNTIGHKKCRGR